MEAETVFLSSVINFDRKSFRDSGLIVKLNTRVNEFQNVCNTTELKSSMLRKRLNCSATTIATLTQFSRDMIVLLFMRTIVVSQ